MYLILSLCYTQSFMCFKTAFPTLRNTYFLLYHKEVESFYYNPGCQKHLEFSVGLLQSLFYQSSLISDFSFPSDCPCLLVHALNSIYLYLVLGGRGSLCHVQLEVYVYCLAHSLYFSFYSRDRLFRLRGCLLFIARAQMCLLQLKETQLSQVLLREGLLWEMGNGATVMECTMKILEELLLLPFCISVLQPVRRASIHSGCYLGNSVQAFSTHSKCFHHVLELSACTAMKNNSFFSVSGILFQYQKQIKILPQTRGFTSDKNI